MFDFMVKLLPNNRILVRNMSDKSSRILKAKEVSSFFEKVLERQIEAQEAEDAKIAEIKSAVKEKK